MNELAQAWAAIAETMAATEQAIQAVADARAKLLGKAPTPDLIGAQTLAREIREDAFAESLKTI